MSPKIFAKSLDLTFSTNDGPVHALNDVNLDINEGDFVSFIGPSGCGKTTFLRVLADLEKPTGGKVQINGVSPTDARKSRAYGYVFQAPGLYPWRTIGKNIKLPLEIIGLSKQEQNDRVERVLRLVDLQDFENKFPWQLSGGMQQRASIARALAFDADILLMDEPFASLDINLKKEICNYTLETLKKNNIPVIFVTHDVEEAMSVSDRIIVIKKGKILQIDSPKKLYNRPNNKCVANMLGSTNQFHISL